MRIKYQFSLKGFIVVLSLVILSFGQAFNTNNKAYADTDWSSIIKPLFNDVILPATIKVLKREPKHDPASAANQTPVSGTDSTIVSPNISTSTNTTVNIPPSIPPNIIVPPQVEVPTNTTPPSVSISPAP